MQPTARPTRFINRPSEAKTHLPRVSEGTKKILEVASKALLVTGVGGSAVFFSAPLSIPLLAGTAAATAMFLIVMKKHPLQPTERGCMEHALTGFMFSLQSGGLAAVILGHYTSHLAKDFVYAPNVVKIGLISGAATAGVGGLLWGLSRCVQSEQVNDRPGAKE